MHGFETGKRSKLSQQILHLATYPVCFETFEPGQNWLQSKFSLMINSELIKINQGCSPGQSEAESSDGAFRGQLGYDGYTGELNGVA